ncbi:MAG: hypothetical protein K2I01_04880 [Lachnospiraceae bacterium]|nr:hypothetical protein [Lachnospiraceae bacterium]MDE6128278.1 hypothetical protein [Lachnospiraceae bacterium]
MEKRYIKDIRLGLQEEWVESVIQRFLSVNHFERKISFAGNVYYEWSKFQGIESGIPQLNRFFQYQYKDGLLHLEAWIGNDKVEMGLTGWGGMTEKYPYLKGMQQLVDELLAPLPKDHYAVAALRKEMRKEKRARYVGAVVLFVLLFGFMAVWAWARQAS